jgi:hypothetical protein
VGFIPAPTGQISESREKIETLITKITKARVGINPTPTKKRIGAIFTCLAGPPEAMLWFLISAKNAKIFGLGFYIGNKNFTVKFTPHLGAAKSSYKLYS